MLYSKGEKNTKLYILCRNICLKYIGRDLEAVSKY